MSDFVELQIDLEHIDAILAKQAKPRLARAGVDDVLDFLLADAFGLGDPFDLRLGGLWRNVGIEPAGGACQQVRGHVFWMTPSLTARSSRLLERSCW